MVVQGEPEVALFANQPNTSYLTQEVLVFKTSCRSLFSSAFLLKWTEIASVKETDYKEPNPAVFLADTLSLEKNIVVSSPRHTIYMPQTPVHSTGGGGDMHTFCFFCFKLL